MRSNKLTPLLSLLLGDAEVVLFRRDERLVGVFKPALLDGVLRRHSKLSRKVAGTRAVEQILAGTFTNFFEWAGPDWTDLNNADTTAVGFIEGAALGDAATDLNTFIAGLADGSIELFQGPLNYQDGSVYLAEGETASDVQIWYTEQLLEGVTGASS